MTQYIQILNHLKSGRPITAMGTLERYGMMRLAARIRDGDNVKVAQYRYG